MAPPLLFALVFLWTPPHFWALAIRYRDDYASAHVPMMPVVGSLERTARQVLLYTLATVAASFVFGVVADMHWFYWTVAAGLAPSSWAFVPDCSPSRVQPRP